MAQPSYQGRFIWTELLCNDANAAAAFYGRILPWASQPFSPGSPYFVFTVNGGAPLAGNMSLPAEARAMGTVPHWRAYIGGDDVDAIVVQASRLGARILEAPRDLPGVGRAALLADPEGARFGVYRPLDAGTPPEPAFSWYELAARSRETALAFYQQLFGWTLGTPMDMGGGFFYQSFGLDGKDIGGAYTIPADRPMPPAWCPYANCASADEVAGKVIAGGGQLCHGPVDVPGGGRIVQFFDPQHAMFAVHSMPRAGAVPKPAAPKPARKPAKKKAAKKKPAKKQPAKKTIARRPAAKKRSAKRPPARKKANRARKAGRRPARKGARRKPARKK
jgi:uncharacterized protein